MKRKKIVLAIFLAAVFLPILLLVINYIQRPKLNPDDYRKSKYPADIANDGVDFEILTKRAHHDDRVTTLQSIYLESKKSCEVNLCLFVYKPICKGTYRIVKKTADESSGERKIEPVVCVFKIR